jgi:hypothetical protein
METQEKCKEEEREQSCIPSDIERRLAELEAAHELGTYGFLRKELDDLRKRNAEVERDIATYKERCEHAEAALKREQAKVDSLVLGVKKGPVEEFEVFSLSDGFACFQYQLCIGGRLDPCRFFLCKIERERIASDLMGTLNRLLHAKNNGCSVVVSHASDAPIKFYKPRDRELLIQLVAHEFLPPTVLLDTAQHLSFASLDLPSTLPLDAEDAATDNP